MKNKPAQLPGSSNSPLNNNPGASAANATQATDGMIEMPDVKCTQVNIDEIDLLEDCVEIFIDMVEEN